MIQDKTDFFIDVAKRSRLFGRWTNRKQLILPDREGFHRFFISPLADHIAGELPSLLAARSRILSE